MPKPHTQKGVTSSSDVAEKMCRKLAPTTLKREARERQSVGFSSALLHNFVQSYIFLPLHNFGFCALHYTCPGLASTKLKLSMGMIHSSFSIHLITKICFFLTRIKFTNKISGQIVSFQKLGTVLELHLQMLKQCSLLLAFN